MIISRRKPSDKRPRYLACTDRALSACETIWHYQRCCPVEVDNLCLKEALGAGDFGVQSFLPEKPIKRSDQSLHTESKGDDRYAGR